MVANPDSLNKIKSYLKSSSLETLIISKKFFRDYSCPEGCAGCCPKFTLDYFDGSERWEKFKQLYPDKVKFFTLREVDGVKIWTDYQTDNSFFHCRNLDRTNGRCTIHNSNPFSCEFELNKFITHEKKGRATLINKLFGRGWNLTRIDGLKGALCQMLPFSYEKFLRDLALLKELLQISRLLKIKTKLPYIVEYLETNKEEIKKNTGIEKEKIEFKEENID